MASLFDEFEETDLHEQLDTDRVFVMVVLPLPLPKLFTYSVPMHLRPNLQKGIRVEVPFGKNKLYAALIYEFVTEVPVEYNPRPILSVLDDAPIVTEKQFRLWEWLAEYYICTLGEVMAAALPAGFKLASETIITLDDRYDEQDLFLRTLNPKESFVIETLVKQGELTIDQIQKLSNQKTIQPLIKTLIEKRLISIKEELTAKYKIKTVKYLQLAPEIRENSALLEPIMEKLERAPKQLDALLAVLQLTENGKIQIPCKLAQEKAGVELSVLNTLQTKGVIVIYEVEVSRLASFDDEGTGNFPLSEIQKAALDSINAQFEQKKVVLLHGVTGSGKTQVFVELMQENLDKGKQVLYLLPEIGLTAQIVGRLQKHFGDKIVVYHSKFNTHERVEIWKSVMNGVPIILGARSALFLPFQNLGLILVDEEHDPSYKQADPSPRYNARDTAAFMAHLYDCRTLLGTATPSLETYFNVQQKKYGLVEMMNRFGGLAMPEIHISDIRAATKSKQMKSMFAPDLLTAIQTCLNNGEQIILFQNRRGYAPMYKCFTCGWTTNCTRCDVSMTYHKHLNELHCHYCGNAHRPPRVCGACGSVHLGVQGFGTEKIEDEIQIYCPDAKTLRMDWDTVKGKTGADDIIQKFDKKQVNVLIGTQMVTKGLDFDNVGLVGVLSADQMLQFPDFRASERAYQLLTQVAGRAGRKKKQGKVIIQAFKTEHPVLGEIQQNDFKAFLERELQEREQFGYPPFARLIGIQLRHKKQPLLEQAANFFAEALRTQVTGAVLGPAVPNISFVREYFRMDILVKLPRNQELIQVAKKAIYQAYIDLKSMSGLSSVRVYIDVDPY